MIVGDWTIKLPSRGLTLGAGSPYTVQKSPGPKGFVGSATLRTHDLQLHTVHGDVLGRDVKGGRTLIIPVAIEGVGTTDDAKQRDARTKLSALTQAWRPVRATDTIADYFAPAASRPIVDLVGEIPMTVQFPGQPEATLTYFGKPRDVAEGEWQWTYGRLLVLLTFACSEPWGFGALQDSGTHFAGGDFTLAAANTGHLGADTDRLWASVQGWTTAGPVDHVPTITNHTDDEQTVVFIHAFGAGTYVQLNPRLATVVDSGAVDRTSWVSGASRWFRLIGGVDNSVLLSNGTDIEFWWLPAYE